jgi:ATP-dependent phosphoenolpyruvate carboxykinase
MVILGTEYAGEMKKGVFTLVNYLAPKRRFWCGIQTNMPNCLRPR